MQKFITPHTAMVAFEIKIESFAENKKIMRSNGTSVPPPVMPALKQPVIQNVTKINPNHSTPYNGQLDL
jgi:hypothetical protein